MATYEAYWQETVKIYADPKGTAKPLSKYAASAALAQAENDIKQMRKNGVIYTGSVTPVNSRATTTDLNRKTPHVVVSSCLDISRWEARSATTRKTLPLPTNRLTKYTIKATVEKWSDGWRVIRDEPQDTPC
ncbi:secreted protein/lipoprotein [Streptomyces sp. NPDC057694]|uniref:secreted protein/lipoprotein n=1 Tax=Streptomyces sp. NPDC057694 TaxID=3346216 RepID=UPI0036BC1510